MSDVSKWIHSREECWKRGIATDGNGAFWTREELLPEIIEKSMRDPATQEGLKLMLEKHIKDKTS